MFVPGMELFWMITDDKYRKMKKAQICLKKDVKKC